MVIKFFTLTLLILNVFSFAFALKITTEADTCIQKVQHDKIDQHGNKDLEICALCLETMDAKSQKLVKLFGRNGKSCGHIFHEDCCSIANKSTFLEKCPLCRRPRLDGKKKPIDMTQFFVIDDFDLRDPRGILTKFWVVVILMLSFYHLCQYFLTMLAEYLATQADFDLNDYPTNYHDYHHHDHPAVRNGYIPRQMQDLPQLPHTNQEFLQLIGVCIRELEQEIDWLARLFYEHWLGLPFLFYGLLAMYCQFLPVIAFCIWYVVMTTILKAILSLFNRLFDTRLLTD